MTILSLLQKTGKPLKNRVSALQITDFKDIFLNIVYSAFVI